MKFITVRDLRGRPGKVWKDLAAEGELVLTSNGKPIALLSSVEDRTFEERLRTLRRAKALQAVASLQGAAARRRPAGIPGAVVEAEIAAVRKKRPL